jgi:hypothetical protein
MKVLKALAVISIVAVLGTVGGMALASGKAVHHYPGKCPQVGIEQKAEMQSRIKEHWAQALEEGKITQEQYEKNSDAVIVLGRKDKLPEGVDPKNLILVGNCLRKYKGQGVHISGCPPAEPHVCWAIVDREDKTKMEDGFRERMAKEEGPWNEYVDRLVAERRNKK